MAFVSSYVPLGARASVSFSTRCTTRHVVNMSLGKKGGGSPFGGWRSHRNRGNSQGGFGAGGAGGAGGGNFSSGGGSGKGPRRSGEGGAASGGNPFTSLWAAYNVRLAENPVTTKAFTSLIGFFLGDLLAQKFIGKKGEEKAEFDWGRSARMASFGFLFHGPTGHYFYGALDRLIVGTSVLKVASKVAIDQIMWAPIFTAFFFGYLRLAERKPMEDVIKKVKDDTWEGVQASWKFWPAAHAINFAFIPTAQRLLYINCLQVGYNVILSILGNK